MSSAHSSRLALRAVFAYTGLVVTPVAPRSRPTANSFGSAESCHHVVLVSVASQFKYVSLVFFCSSYRIAVFSAGISQPFLSAAVGGGAQANYSKDLDHLLRDYCVAVSPPSRNNFCPVMKSDAGDTRNAIALITS